MSLLVHQGGSVKHEAEAARGADEDVGATRGVGAGAGAVCGASWGARAACGATLGSEVPPSRQEVCRRRQRGRMTCRR
jgi:hypothetical protein